MERDQMTLGEQTRVLLAEQGIHVSDEGVARARRKLREADERVTPEVRAQIASLFRMDEPAA